MRLVEPCIESLNNDDCFIFLASNHLFLLTGEHANIIEKSKSSEYFDWIRLNRDLGLKANVCVVKLGRAGLLNDLFNRKHDGLELSSDELDFYSILTQNSTKNSSNDFYSFENSLADEDEKYELLINDTNMVYQVRRVDECEEMDQDDEEQLDNDDVNSYFLEPVCEQWGSILTYNMLDENDVFVFDFGTELYVWNGRNARCTAKKAALQLALKLYESGFDYSQCVMSPFKVELNMDKVSNENYFKSELKRPKWTVFGRQSQNVETVLFKEKFFDWPSQKSSPSLKKFAVNNKSLDMLSSKLVKESSAMSAKKQIEPKKEIFNFEPLSGHELVRILNENHENNPINLILECANLGRGRHWHDSVERRSFDIVTERVQMCKVLDNKIQTVQMSEFGELLDCYTYVIKWHYKVNAVGFRTLKGEASQHQAVTGRDRYALFFWHGKHSKQNEKGASALLSIDFGNSNADGALANTNSLNADSSLSMNLSEKGSSPHVLVFQHKEMAAFCQLFNGSMLVLAHQSDEETSEQWRMFELRGELAEEAHLIEMKSLSMEHLRSKTSFLFTNSSTKMFVLWHGCCSTELQRELIKSCAKLLATK